MLFVFSCVVLLQLVSKFCKVHIVSKRPAESEAQGLGWSIKQVCWLQKNLSWRRKRVETLMQMSRRRMFEMVGSAMAKLQEPKRVDS